MNQWRTGLLIAILAVTWGGYAWMYLVSQGGLRGSLSLLTVAFAGLTVGVFWHYRTRLTPRLITAYIALGSIIHLGTAGLIVGADRLWDLGVLPALESNWHHFLIGGLATIGAALTWTRARGSSAPVAVPAVSADGPEPPPPATAELAPPDWDSLEEGLAADPVRLKQARALQRIVHAIEGSEPPAVRLAAARRVVLQEALRLQTDVVAEARDADDDDVLSQAASLLEWGAQKLPELAELDVSDLMMAKAIADIRAQSSAVQHVFVDHRNLLAIHPIDRATADEKCNQRAEAARAALPLLEANGMRLSEELIAGHEELAAFKSVTGFQVVQVDADSYVTFEGNGRREALARAFGDQGVQVEVRLYTFDDPETERAIQRRVERVRSWKGVEDG